MKMQGPRSQQGKIIISFLHALPYFKKGIISSCPYPNSSLRQPVPFFCNSFVLLAKSVVGDIQYYYQTPIACDGGFDGSIDLTAVGMTWIHKVINRWTLKYNIYVYVALFPKSDNTLTLCIVVTNVTVCWSMVGLQELSTQQLRMQILGVCC